MIQILIIKKVLVFLLPLFALYFLKRMGRRGQYKGKSKLSDFDPSTPLRASKSKIVEGEIVDESSTNRP